MIKITETDSLYDNLETMSLNQILENINKEDTKVPSLIKQVIPEIDKLISSIVPKM